MSTRGNDSRRERGSVRLLTVDLDRSVVFYTDVLGFGVIHREKSLALLGVAGFDIHVVLSTDGVGTASTESGHLSIRFDSREGLAGAVGALGDARVAIERAEDTGFRDAIYVRDPDGHLIELYRDRPRDEWRLAEDGVFASPRGLDLDELRAPARTGAALSEPTRSRLADVRIRLLNLHKVLLDDAKTTYELDRGRIGSNANLLQLVINDPWFAWLHPLSELVVRIDETLQPDAPATESDGVMMLEQVERLLSPAAATEEFAQRYFEALQRQPAVIVAHAEVRRILKQAR
jgi:catechol 2,3-dioxygenase-like lactoylglutathione lyase family enzyme